MWAQSKKYIIGTLGIILIASGSYSLMHPSVIRPQFYDKYHMPAGFRIIAGAILLIYSIFMAARDKNNL
ncbi:MAG: hypothetical protein H0X33_11900 [Taibaiella sp.]|nr:hypothetical protein [Taibaiella sp.]